MYVPIDFLRHIVARSLAVLIQEVYCLCSVYCCIFVRLIQEDLYLISSDSDQLALKSKPHKSFGLYVVNVFSTAARPKAHDDLIHSKCHRIPHVAKEFDSK